MTHLYAWVPDEKIKSISVFWALTICTFCFCTENAFSFAMYMWRSHGGQGGGEGGCEGGGICIYICMCVKACVARESDALAKELCACLLCEWVVALCSFSFFFLTNSVCVCVCACVCVRACACVCVRLFCVHRNMWIFTLPYYSGIAVSVGAAFISIPLVFDLDTALW